MLRRDDKVGASVKNCQKTALYWAKLVPKKPIFGHFWADFYRRAETAGRELSVTGKSRAASSDVVGVRGGLLYSCSLCVLFNMRERLSPGLQLAGKIF